MEIKLSENIDASTCTACKSQHPWDSTIAKLKTKLQAHDVTWPHFVIMHGKDKRCKDMLNDTSTHDPGLYVVATDPKGKKAQHAKVFANKNGYYAGVTTILKDQAF